MMIVMARPFRFQMITLSTRSRMSRRLDPKAWASLEAELGPAKPSNYREMLEKQPPTSLIHAHNVKNEETEELVLMSPGF